jgi:hypothetical protein
MPEMATITVKRATCERLKRLCLKVETYEKFLNTLLDMAELLEKHPDFCEAYALRDAEIPVIAWRSIVEAVKSE